MGSDSESVFVTGHSVSSDVLRRFVSSMTDTAVVVFAGDKGSVTLSTFSGGRCGALTRAAEDVAECLRRSPGQVGGVQPITLSHSDTLALESSAGRDCDHAHQRWCGFSLQMENGVRDRIALQLDCDEDFGLTSSYLKKIWPILREDCLREALATLVPTSGDEAFHWMILDRIDVALIILDGRGLMYRVNAAARQLLREARVLRRGRGGIFAANEADSRAFRKAVAKCATADPPELADTVIFVASKPLGQRVPVTLSRYVHDGFATRFVVAMLPMPPDPKRVEQLVQRMGLTSSEAKVAALMQLGLTNKEAAASAGFKEQTFNTYAKRVLSKLNVSGRTEMAQLLTWQASGGRIV